MFIEARRFPLFVFSTFICYTKVTSVDLRGNVRSRAGQSLVEAALSPNSTVADVDGIPVLAIKSGSMTNVSF
jgi:hypothetical protein